MEFILRDIDADFWKEVKVKVIEDGHSSVKVVLFALLSGWVKGKFKLAPIKEQGK